MIYKMVLMTNDSMYRIESLQKPSFADMKKLVGGYITQTLGTFEGGEVRVLVDEDGSHKDLPLNHMASSCAYQELVGDALLLLNFDTD